MLKTTLLLYLSSTLGLASPIEKRQSTCSNFGGYQCSGASLQQCAYGAGNVLGWTTIQTCGAGTVCSVSGYIGCVAGSPSAVQPSSTSKTFTGATTSPISKTPLSSTATPVKSSTTLPPTSSTNKPTTTAPPTTRASPLPTGGTSGPNKYKIVSYWGAHPTGGEQNLKVYCDTKAYSIINLSFIDKILPKVSLSADITQRPNGYGLPQIATDVLYCQSIGVKIGVSVGGYVGSVGLTSGGSAVAQDLWDNFLGGSTPLANRVLPGVVLDGVDLDIESATGNNAGYAQLANQLRNLVVASGKDYYISAAPQCVIPDASMDYTLKNGWFDFVAVQFYSSGCGIGFAGPVNGPNYDNNASVWNSGQGDWLHQTTLWPNKNVKLLVGFPASSSGGNFGGEVDPSPYVKQYVPTWAAENPSAFGGLMWWDTFWMGLTPAGPSQYVTLLNSLP
ncbi:glycoside hydrolase superfamily [Chytriomyces sp. MP71]|nr:glycoside hydrolase superfamily [Chytriomyces sp. MP71]